MNKEDLLMKLKIDRDYAERQVKQEIEVLRGILNRVEDEIKEGRVRADDGLQGNEWRLYKEMANLERLNETIKDIENLQQN